MAVLGGFYNAGGPSNFQANARLGMSGVPETSLRIQWTDTFGSAVRYGAFGEVSLLRRREA